MFYNAFKRIAFSDLLSEANNDKVLQELVWQFDPPESSQVPPPPVTESQADNSSASQESFISMSLLLSDFGRVAIKLFGDIEKSISETGTLSREHAATLFLVVESDKRLKDTGCLSKADYDAICSGWNQKSGVEKQTLINRYVKGYGDLLLNNDQRDVVAPDVRSADFQTIQRQSGVEGQAAPNNHRRVVFAGPTSDPEYSNQQEFELFMQKNEHLSLQEIYNNCVSQWASLTIEGTKELYFKKYMIKFMEKSNTFSAEDFAFAGQQWQRKSDLIQHGLTQKYISEFAPNNKPLFNIDISSFSAPSKTQLVSFHIGNQPLENCTATAGSAEGQMPDLSGGILDELL